MDGKASSSPVAGPQKASNPDELFMQQSLLFSDTLKDLKNLSNQLYSAADYFETSYSKEGQKRLAVETLKDYTIKAVINTVDHLGTVAYKVNTFLDGKIGEISALELSFSCLEQRVQTCQEYTSRAGLSQLSLALKIPKHHKRYIFPVEETTDAKSNYHSRRLSADYNLCQLKNAVQETIRGNPSFFRERHSPLHSPRFPSRQGAFTFTRNSSSKMPEKRAASPQRFPLLRSGSRLKRSISPSCVRGHQRYPTETQRSVSSTTYAERVMVNDVDEYSGKSKQLFKALLSMRKSKKGSSLYKYLDDN